MHKKDALLQAERLLRDTLGPELYLALCATDSFIIEGKAKDIYSLSKKVKTRICNKASDIFEACIQLPEDCPPADRVVAEYLLIKNDEEKYLATANLTRLNNYGMHVHGDAQIYPPITLPAPPPYATHIEYDQANDIPPQDQWPYTNPQRWSEFTVGDTVTMRQPRPQEVNAVAMRVAERDYAAAYNQHMRENLYNYHKQLANIAAQAIRNAVRIESGVEILMLPATNMPDRTEQIIYAVIDGMPFENLMSYRQEDLVERYIIPAARHIANTWPSFNTIRTPTRVAAALQRNRPEFNNAEYVSISQDLFIGLAFMYDYARLCINHFLVVNAVI